ncbi:amino acid permease [Metamycoplasma hyosynoviae]|uniref:APC family permease n=1 Tax=Metamycoplasma hyosynoviae TaxID=29559 RepID=UPI00046187A2|nr:APC family permease [Metamycoplasma hyosynoviae]KDE41589.1 amino acid permease [Metamycoplasma hyosynoviae]KDE43132.1 amino acid permease [Metamycoplasma hyosynoviae]KDE43533.1 amino acid permease [Metamycoplasma hyosynoviae]KDE43650.1 amino acid permease [Metamycoplasma hyosynoviae]KDE45361.1 amino acid permease [Metamycoplasma hyosynoviae]
MSDEKLVVTSSTPKKISFFSAIIFVLGATIGAGIFLRAKTVLQNSGLNIVWAIIVWLIAGFAVVCMALGLIEVASGRNDNLGMIGWAKAFNTLKIYKAVKFFMTYLYLPFTYFFMPYYVIVQFQDGLSAFGASTGFGKAKDYGAWMYLLLGVLMTVWMVFSAGISSRAGNIQNWIVTAFKFVPLVGITLIGFIFAGKYGIKYESVKISEIILNKKTDSFLGISPFLLVFGSLGGIFFAFDGFYVTAGIQSEMKHPEKTPAALTIGLLSMTAIYITVATAMTLGAGNIGAKTDKIGDFYSFGDKLKELGHGWAFGLINICISVGIIGILNGFTMWATRWVEDLIKEGEIWVPASVYKYMKNSKMPMVGALFVLSLSLPFIVILTIIGAYGYHDSWGLGDDYGARVSNLLTFSDLMADWMAIFSFGFIALSIVGALQNRKKHFIAVTENKHTKWAGITAVVIVATVMIFKALDPFFSLFINIGKAQTQWDDPELKLKDAIVGNGVASALFIIYCIVSFCGAPIERIIAEKREAKLEAKLKVNPTDENLLISKELNDIVLKTFREARVN